MGKGPYCAFHKHTDPSFRNQFVSFFTARQSLQRHRIRRSNSALRLADCGPPCVPFWTARQLSPQMSLVDVKHSTSNQLTLIAHMFMEGWFYCIKCNDFIKLGSPSFFNTVQLFFLLFSLQCLTRLSGKLSLDSFLILTSLLKNETAGQLGTPFFYAKGRFYSRLPRNVTYRLQKIVALFVFITRWCFWQFGRNTMHCDNNREWPVFQKPCLVRPIKPICFKL